jgi:triacylglycerol lipase
VTGRLLLEQRWPFERAALLTDPVHFGRGVPHGTGQPVLLIPGFLAGDASLLTLSRWLRRIGYEPVRAVLRVNAGCAGATVDRLAGRLREVAATKGPVALIGQSRGGLLGRALALRERERVAGLVTLGSPCLDPGARHVEVASSHAGMGAEVSAYIAIAAALRSFWPR